MIKFKDITTADKAVIQHFTLWGERQNCDLSFANLISWKFLYNTQYAVVDDYLVFRFYSGRHLAYMMPLPKPVPTDDGRGFRVKPCDECSVSVIRAIRDDSIAMGHPFLMLGVCNYMRDLIEKHFPGVFEIKADRDRADYIYTRDKLAGLSGKKLQSKRNHVNKFKSLYPDYEYHELTPELIPQCIELEKLWRITSKGGGADNGEELSEELRAMTRAFNRWDELGLRGGTIWVGGRLVAFTFGCPVNQTTFDVCVEKADISYEGAFSVINQEFARHLPEQYFYVNREEDMGDEGLRRAKMSYRPDILLEKNVIMEKHPLADFEDEERILRETRELWQTVFPDPEVFVNLYFSRVYKPGHNVCCQINRHVAGALQTLPYTMLYHGQEVPTAYISGVSVHPDFRRQDIGTNLMRQAHFRLYHSRCVFATLIPAEEWLRGWYAKCGYSENITCTPPPADVTVTTFEEFDRLQRSRDCILLHDADGYDIIREDIRLAGDAYKPQTENIRAMIRVVNARKALQMYAARHPSECLSLRISGDEHIPMNNAYFIVDKGTVRQTDEPDAAARRLSISGLAEFIFGNEQAEMNLMLNS